MITRELISSLYKKYRKPAKSVDMLNLALLFDYAAKNHNIFINPDTEELVIGSIDSTSPFHKIPVSHIHAIVPFEEWVAIVMHSSILFLNRKDSKVAVDIKPITPLVHGPYPWLVRSHDLTLASAKATRRQASGRGALIISAGERQEKAN
ncbi:MAG: hypothetical protein UHP27_04930 [Muribaculaceae bacterium]|nr:hypothetical protein [Muribaculaceae bacterium]